MDDEQDRAYDAPRRPPTGCACRCRADINDNIPENADRLPRFAFGEAQAGSCKDAKRAAARQATRKLGAQPKHLGCKCTK